MYSLPAIGVFLYLSLDFIVINLFVFVVFFILFRSVHLLQGLDFPAVLTTFNVYFTYLLLTCLFLQPGQTATEYGVTVVVQQQVGAIQVTDAFYIVLCDTNDLDAGFLDVTQVDVS